jgi:hypothetical protein
MTASSERFELNITVGAASFSGSGEVDRVMTALEKFTELLGGAPPEIASGNGSGAEGGHGGQKAPLPVFLKEKNPQGNPLTATAIVAWAEYNEGKEALTASEIKDHWKKTSLKAPGNLSRDVGGAVKDGLLEKHGGGYRATGHGKSRLGLDTH